MYKRNTGVTQFRSFRFLYHTVATMEADRKPSKIPQPVILCPNNIPPPVTPSPHPGEIESPEGEGTDYEEIPIGIPEYAEILFDGAEYDGIPCDKIEGVKNEMDNPPIWHGTPSPGNPIQPLHVFVMEAVSSQRLVRRRTAILTSTLVLAAATVASIVGGTMLLSKGNDTQNRNQKKCILIVNL